MADKRSATSSSGGRAHGFNGSSSKFESFVRAEEEAAHRGRHGDTHTKWTWSHFLGNEGERGVDARGIMDWLDGWILGCNNLHSPSWQYHISPTSLLSLCAKRKQSFWVSFGCSDGRYTHIVVVLPHLSSASDITPISPSSSLSNHFHPHQWFFRDHNDDRISA